MQLHVLARVFFLLLFAAAALASPASPVPVDGQPAGRGDADQGRKVVHSGGKLRITVKSGMHGHGHGHAAADAAPGDLPNPDGVLIKAPRRFVPKPNSPVCTDGTNADHKGRCRNTW